MTENPKSSNRMTKAELLQEFIVQQEALRKATNEVTFQQQKVVQASRNLEEMYRLLSGLVSYTSAMALCELVNREDRTAFDIVDQRLSFLRDQAKALLPVAR